MNIIGHQRHVERLSRLAAENHLSHAYLFLGTEGIGKKLTALELARKLLCPNGGAPECGCPSCEGVKLAGEKTVKLGDRGQTNPDLYMLDDRDALKIDNVRILRDMAMLTPYSGRWKVFIINNAHIFATLLNAANALLKTLEEPGENTVFILITHREERLLATLRSRCQTVRFEPLTESELSQIAREKGIEADSRLIKYAGGSVSTLAALSSFDFLGFVRGIEERDVDTLARLLFSLNRGSKTQREDIELLGALLAPLTTVFANIYKKNQRAELGVFLEYLNRLGNDMDYNINLNITLLDLLVKLIDAIR